MGGCGGLGNVLSRKPDFPECVFGKVPETSLLDLSEVIQDSRQLAETILSGNPTNCAVRLAMKMYNIYASVGRLRPSEVGMHGLRFNPKNMLAKLQASWDEPTNDCVDSDAGTKEDSVAIEQRLRSKIWSFDRKVVADEECTVIKRYNGSSFGKDHNGGFEGCKIECLNDPSCNGFNMDLKFDITIKQPECELLDCPFSLEIKRGPFKKAAKHGYVSFIRTGHKGLFEEAAEAPLYGN